MAGVGRTTNRASHSPPAVGRVFRCPAVSLAELLHSQLRDHRRDIRRPRTALGRHQGIDGERRGVVRITPIAACYARGPVDARMLSDERNRTIDGAGGLWWWDPAKFRRDPVDSIDQLQGYKGGLLRAEFGNATVHNPHERGPWLLSENISVARTFGINATRLEFRLQVFNLLDRKIWGHRTRASRARTFGRVTTLANSPRQVQLGLRFEF